MRCASRSVNPRQSIQGGTNYPDLVAAWPELPEALKAGILAMIRAAARS